MTEEMRKLPRVHVFAHELDQWIDAMADLAKDPYADPGGENRLLAEQAVSIEGVEVETEDCVRVGFTDFDAVGFPPRHTITIVVPDEAVYPVAEWGRDGAKPLADHWYWSSGDVWVAVRADWEPQWWADVDPELLSERPERWSRPIDDMPTTGRLAYCIRETHLVRCPATA